MTRQAISSADLMPHADAMYRYALARVSSPQQAEDLVQDSMLAAVRQWDHFAGRSELRTWLIGILRHKIHDHYRWKKRHPADLAQADETQDDDVSRVNFSPMGRWRQDPNAGLEVLDADPEDALQRSQLRAAIQVCIDALPQRQQQVFVMRELQGLEAGDCCKKAGIARASLSVLLYRARLALRACLQKSWVQS